MAAEYNILVVDDDAVVRQTLRETLSHQRYEVRVAEDSESALLMARAEVPDLILCD